MFKTINASEKEIYSAAGIVVVVVLIVLILLMRYTEDNLLKGFWRATDNFCHEAELELFLVYIGDNNSYLGHNRPCFFLAANHEGIILNNPVDINFGMSGEMRPWMSSCKKYNACIDWHDEPPEDENVFPTDFQIAYYPQNNKLVFYKDEEVLAILWKDSEMSALDIETRLLPSEVPDQHEAESIEEHGRDRRDIEDSDDRRDSGNEGEEGEEGEDSDDGNDEESDDGNDEES